MEILLEHKMNICDYILSIELSSCVAARSSQKMYEHWKSSAFLSLFGSSIVSASLDSAQALELVFPLISICMVASWFCFGSYCGKKSV